MSAISRAIAVRLALVVVIGAGFGCAPEARPAPDAQVTDHELEERRLAWRGGGSFGNGGVRPVPKPQSTAVAAGPAPLAYIAEQPGPIWVTDDAGRQWGPVDVDRRAVVRVAEPTGVAIGGAKLDPGPLPPGRSYTIHVGVTGGDVFRSGEVQQVAPPRGAKRR